MDADGSPAIKKISAIAKRSSVDSFARHVVWTCLRGGRVNESRVPPLEPELVAFIEGAFPSVWALETLMLLRREPGTPWSAQRLVFELRASGPLVDDCLARRIKAGLVVAADEAFRYAPANARLLALCDALDAAYRERPVAVTNAIATHRPDALKGFADSFRLGGWKS